MRMIGSVLDGAKMHPVAIKLYLQAVFCIDRLVFVFLLDLFKDRFTSTPLLNSILFLEIK